MAPETRTQPLFNFNRLYHTLKWQLGVKTPHVHAKNKSHPSMKSKRRFSELFPTFNILWDPDLKTRDKGSGVCTHTTNKMLVDRPMETTRVCNAWRDAPRRSHRDSSHSALAEPTLPQVQLQELHLTFPTPMGSPSQAPLYPGCCLAGTQQLFPDNTVRSRQLST